MNCTGSAISLAGYRHVRLRTPTNQPLELSTLFVFSRLSDELAPAGVVTSGSLDTPTSAGLRDDQAPSKWPLRAVFAPKSEKEVCVALFTWNNSLLEV